LRGVPATERVSKEEMLMSAHGQTTMWGTDENISQAGASVGWYQYLRQWWQTHKALRQQVRREILNARWDAKREVVRPIHAEAAAEMLASQQTFSMAIRYYGFTM
jgi:hypothetical protein